MASINSARVVTAGLLAGLVMNIVDTAVNLTLMKDDMAGLAQKFGADPNVAASLSGALPWIVTDFGTGLLIVWTYAAIRPRLGAGPGTALLAGLVPFLAVELVLWAFTASLGMMPMSSFMKGSVGALVATVLGSLAGGWAYREEAAALPSAARTI